MTTDESKPQSELLARRFHEAYERLAPSYGYTTRSDSAVPWESVPLMNKRLMVATVEEACCDLFEQKEVADAALGKIALMQPGALAIIRDNGFVFEDIGKEPGNWQHLAFTLYTLICEIDMEARNALNIELGEDADSNPASEPRCTCPAGSYDAPNAVHTDYCASNQDRDPAMRSSDEE